MTCRRRVLYGLASVGRRLTRKLILPSTGYNGQSRTFAKLQWQESLLEMMSIEPYNDVVRTYFFSPQHAGRLSRDYSRNLEAMAQESDRGPRIHLYAGLVENTVAEMRFQAWGCPHLIAAGEYLCREKEGGAVAGLGVFTIANTMGQLSVPVEKTGRILLLEDALSSLCAQYSSAD